MRMIGVGLATAAAVLVLAASALAGSFHVYSCRTPSGAAAPVDGWAGSLAPGGAYDDYAVDTCEQGGALVAALGDTTSHAANVDRATWTYEAPPWANVKAATLWRAGYLHGKSGEPAVYQSWLSAPAPADVFSECIFTAGCHTTGDLVEPMAEANRLIVPDANLGTHIYANVSCADGAPGSECAGGFSDPNNYAAVLYIYAADIVLEQSAGPSVSNVGGELATAATIAGTSDVTFSATDPGAGVYEALVTVDGQVVQRTVLNENGGKCHDVGETTDGLPAFLYLQPCLASVSADVGLDTAGLADGTHHVVVTVTDAAGNSAPVLDRNVTVANSSAQGPQAPQGGGTGASSPSVPTGAPSQGQAAPNGTGASPQASLSVSWRGSHSGRLASPYGHARLATGRLTGLGGAPIAGALIEVVATPSYSGAVAASVAQPRTNANGAFTVAIPAGAPSATIRFVYRPSAGAQPAATGALSLAVKARVQLSISPHAVTVGHSIRFSGRLQGGPIPRGGKALVLEARSGGAWIKFNVIRTDRAGRFHASYRFRFPGPVRYSFRVLCEAEADYPYVSSASNSVSVLER